jgi:hypothetical protein
LSNTLFIYSHLLLPELHMTRKTRHVSLDRLLAFAAATGSVGPSALATALGETEQVITNWGARGVSAAGAIKAEEKFGCSPIWILRGIERPSVQASAGVSPVAYFLAQEIDKIAPAAKLVWISKLGNLVSAAQQGMLPTSPLIDTSDLQIPSAKSLPLPGGGNAAGQPSGAPVSPRKPHILASKPSL